MQLNSVQWLELLVNTQNIPMCCMRLAENATLSAAKLLALYLSLHGRSACASRRNVQPCIGYVGPMSCIVAARPPAGMWVCELC